MLNIAIISQLRYYRVMAESLKSSPFRSYMVTLKLKGKLVGFENINLRCGEFPEKSYQ